MIRTYAQRYGAAPPLRLYDDTTSDPDNSAKWHADAIAVTRTLADLMGYEPYCDWVDAQTWLTWREFHAMVSDKLDAMTEDCDCGANGRDACPLCVKPTAQAEELPY